MHACTHWRFCIMSFIMWEKIHKYAWRMSESGLIWQVQGCGSMVTEEQPHAMLVPMEYFLMGYGLYRPCYSNGSPRSPLSPSCISPELLSPESMGLKLKPIKTRVSVQVWWRGASTHLHMYLIAAFLLLLIFLIFSLFERKWRVVDIEREIQNPWECINKNNIYLGSFHL